MTGAGKQLESMDMMVGEACCEGKRWSHMCRRSSVPSCQGRRHECLHPEWTEAGVTGMTMGGIIPGMWPRCGTPERIDGDGDR